MYIKNKSVYFLLIALCLMIASIYLSLEKENQMLVNFKTLYISVGGGLIAEEYSDVVIRNEKFEAVTVLNESNKSIDIFTKGKIHTNKTGIFSVNINQEYINDFDMNDPGGELLVYGKYLDSRRKLSIFKSVQVLEKLPNNYRLIISNSPVKKMIAVKLGEREDF
ncbi:hypothetical protein [Vibrio campbellii]|uniref:hypothetical protein n=1 Tax=Vibrio campbellii TaxID=680 RepID=UPI00210A3D8F|nr:hypothetical protein [Vibrio campbellii]UTZ41779.1 hypothetical protein HB764_10550 [Vibrio campbellii]